MSAISELIERVEKATGADREIDAEIMRLDDPEFHLKPPRGVSAWRGVLCLGAAVDVLPAYTASLDAALALVEAKLPGQACAIGTMKFAQPGIPWATIWTTGGFPTFNADAATPALALLAALPRALEEQKP